MRANLHMLPWQPLHVQIHICTHSTMHWTGNIYASDYMCGTSSSPFWQSASSSNTSLPRRSPESQTKLNFAQTLNNFFLALVLSEHFWSGEYCIAECIITNKIFILLTTNQVLIVVQIFRFPMKCHLHTCTFSVQTPLPGSTLFPQLRDWRILVLTF